MNRDGVRDVSEVIGVDVGPRGGATPPEEEDR
jgi:hypothetical protein